MTIYGKHSRPLIESDYQNDRCFIDMEISGNDMRDCCFPGLYMSNVTIESSVFDCADLGSSSCEFTSFKQSDLKEIVFTDSKQFSSIYLNSNLIKADFSNSKLYKMEMRNCHAHGISFHKARIIESLFYECEMFKVKISESLIIGTRFMPGSKGEFGGLNKSKIVNSLIIDTSFEAMNLQGALFVNSIIIGCSFNSACLVDADFTNSKVFNCDFDNAEF